MNGFDLTYCTNEKCSRIDCRRHHTKTPTGFFVWLSKFKEKNCKYYLRGVSDERNDISK
jgi:hypothetical protein